MIPCLHRSRWQHVTGLPHGVSAGDGLWGMTQVPTEVVKMHRSRLVGACRLHPSQGADNPVSGEAMKTGAADRDTALLGYPVQETGPYDCDCSLQR